MGWSGDFQLVAWTPEPQHDLLNCVSKSIFLFWAFHSAFPHHRDAPACLEQLFLNIVVANPVAENFLGPIAAVGFRKPILGAVVSVPEATVNEDDDMVFG